MSIWKCLKMCSNRCRGSWPVLRVLMWKHLKEHLHCWTSVLWRIIQGCSVFCALLAIRLSLLSSNDEGLVNVNIPYLLPVIWLERHHSTTFV